MAKAFSILLVESNHQGLQTHLETLSGNGFSVMTAMTARTAFDLLFRHDFDLVILSAQLPNTNIITTVSQIRNRERSRTTPILLLATKDKDGTLIAESQAMGFVDHITKPVSPEQLKAKVDAYVGRFLEARKQPNPYQEKKAEPSSGKSILESEEARNHAAFEGMQDTAILWENTQGYIVASNKLVRRVLGYEQQEILGLHISKFFSPDDLQAGRPESEMRLARETGMAIDELWHVRKDGSRFWAVGLVTPIWKSPGELEGYIKVLRDRSDDKIREDLARDTEERYKQLLDSTSEGIFGFDLNGLCTFANVSGLGQLGFPDEQAIVGLDIHKIIPHSLPDGAPCDGGECPVMAMVLEGQETHGEADFQKADGSRFPVEYRIRPIRSGRSVTGGVVTFLDSTERKKTEERIKSLEKRARQSHKLESVGRLAGGVAHELNNDLTAVIGHGELLLARLDSPVQVKLGLEEILSSGNKAADLVRKLLTFAGRQPVVGQSIQLESFLKERFPRFRSEAGDNVRLSLDVDPDLPPVFSEPGQLEQAIISILANAREAIAEEGSLAITARKMDLTVPADSEKILVKPGIYDCLAFTDTGRGIPEEAQERLFDPFYSTKGMGTMAVGLGLSSAYGFIQQCGGTIHVESEPGRGTAVQVYLPTE